MTQAALVTGAARRLGRAMAVRLAARGCDVAVHYSTSVADAEDVVREARALGVKAEAVQANLMDAQAVETLVRRAREALGTPLTVLINNASTFEYDHITTVTSESWDRAMGSNLRAPVFLTHAFAAQCPKGAHDAVGEPIASGVVINMVDQRVRKLTPEFSSYTIAKMGLWALTRTAAQGLGPDIRVNGIGPGPTMQGARQSAEHFAAQRAATPLKRGSDPEEICRTMEYILDTPGLTGQLLCLDGGQHLAWQTPDVLGVE
ncbi:MAG: SDR family oxidoreductase [Pseudomonadota bacterium]